jgi:hypothetical protein
MPRFKDAKGTEWTLDITVGAIKRIKSAGFGNFADPLTEEKAGEGTPLSRLSLDPIYATEVMFYACKPQADAAGVDHEAFDDLLNGDAYAAAYGALHEGLLLFSRQAGRPEIAKVIEKQIAVVLAGLKIVAAKADEIDTAAILEGVQAKADGIDTMQLVSDAMSRGETGT